MASRTLLKRGGGFDPQQPFLGLFHFSFPAVNRYDLGDDIDAGSELAVDQCLGDPARFIDGAGGSHDDSFVGHMKVSLPLLVYGIKDYHFRKVAGGMRPATMRFVKVGSFQHWGENFRLTADGGETFTGKLGGILATFSAASATPCIFE